jgi:hypothetical protein
LPVGGVSIAGCRRKSQSDEVVRVSSELRVTPRCLRGPGRTALAFIGAIGAGVASYFAYRGTRVLAALSVLRLEQG